MMSTSLKTEDIAIASRRGQGKEGLIPGGMVETSWAGSVLLQVVGYTN